MNFENFAEKFNITEETLKQIKNYFLFTEKDEKVLKNFKDKIKHIPEEVFDDFYKHLLSFIEIKKILTKEDNLIEKLKKLQKEYLEFLLTTDIDINYVKKAFLVGKKHWENKVRIDYYQGAYLKYIDAILKYYEDKLSTKELMEFRKSFLKLIFIDMHFVLKTYYYLTNVELETEKKKYKAVFEGSFDGIVVVNEDGKIIDLNYRIEELTGLKRKDLLFKDFRILIPKKDEKHVSKLFENALQSKDKFNLYYDLYLYNYKKDIEIPVEAIVSKLELKNKKTFIVSFRDIEDKLEKERKITSLSRLYKILYETNALLTRVSDIDTLFESVIDILVTEGKFNNVIFVRLEEKNLKIIKSYKHTRFTEKQLESILSSIEKKEFIKFDNGFYISLPIILDKYILTTANLKDEKYALILSSEEIKYLSEDEKLLLRQIVYDIAFAIYSIRKKEEVKYLSYYDIVTDLPNRKFFLERLETVIEEARERYEKLALILIDIDKFKNINDAFGFGMGDLTLKILSSRIKKILRGRDLIARVGSDEFGIIVFGIEKKEDIIKLINRIKETLKTPIKIDGQNLFITLSIGVSIFPDDGFTLSDIFAAANAALREVKNKGGDNFIFYNPKMKKMTLEAIELEIELRKAISKGQFVLYYQPIVDLKNMKIVGAEALIRWKHPEKGIIPPYKFIPILEDSNMILDVGEWVIEDVIKQLKKWEKYNLHIAISLNVSVKQLVNSSISQLIKRKLSEFGGNPKNIVIEITETTMMENLQLIKKEIEELDKLGIKVEIDDFGTGYSSLAYLKKLPVFALKIDREFIKDLTKDEDDKVIVRAIINLAHVLDKKVVAEGVEDKEQLDFLKNEGCDYAQGYLFSAPVPPEEFESLYLKFNLN